MVSVDRETFYFEAKKKFSSATSTFSSQNISGHSLGNLFLFICFIFSYLPLVSNELLLQLLLTLTGSCVIDQIANHALAFTQFCDFFYHSKCILFCNNLQKLFEIPAHPPNICLLFLAVCVCIFRLSVSFLCFLATFVCVFFLLLCLVRFLRSCIMRNYFLLQNKRT